MEQISVCQPTDIHQFDALINTSYDADQLDSFLLLSNKKIELCQTTDSLNAWADAVSIIQNFFADNPERSIQEADKFLKKLWRKPLNADETSSLMHIYILNGYFYNKKLGLVYQSLSA